MNAQPASTGASRASHTALAEWHIDTTVSEPTPSRWIVNAKLLVLDSFRATLYVPTAAEANTISA
jgi:hypothetical protein